MVPMLRVQEEDVEVMWNVFGSEVDTAGRHLGFVGGIVFLCIRTVPQLLIWK